MMLPDQKTKIIATIGPASESPDVMESMIKAGMNIARINLAHGDQDGHRRVIHKLRAAARAVGQKIAIMADLPGPKMRIGRLVQEPVELEPGALFTLTTQEVIGDKNRVSVSFQRLPKILKLGDVLFLNDGIIQIETMKIEGPDVICRVIVGGELRSHKGLNIPGIDLGIGAFTENDRESLKFALEQGVDAISQSFVECAADIVAVRDASEAIGYDPFIIAKIERSRALEHMDDIIEAADAIMVARGELGVEIPMQQIALVQKRLIRHTNRVGKPVITATQMLESMVSNPRPTRAESTDVANAIIDGTDCIMLSEESAMGKYPMAAVAMLAKIAATTEPQCSSINWQEIRQNQEKKEPLSVTDLIALSVDAVLEQSSAAAVFVPTHSGHTALFIARFRPSVWIVAVSSRKETCQRLMFSRGVYPVYEPDYPKDWLAYVQGWVSNHALKGNLAILTEGPSTAHPKTNHRMEIIQIDSIGK